MKKISIKVNSKKIPVNPFVSLFMIKTIEGMITSLRGVVGKPDKIELTIENDKLKLDHRRKT